MPGTALREIAARFGVQFDDRQLRTGMGTIQSGIGQLRAFGAAILGSQIVQGARQMVREFVDTASALNDQAQQLSLNTTELQELQHAAQLTGVGAEALQGALGRLTLSISNAHGGSGAAASAFRRLGVATRDASGHARSIGDVMDDVAENMTRIEDPTTRAGLANDLFGRSGRRLLPILHSGAGGLMALRGELRQLGGGLSEDAIAQADELGDSMDRWHVASRSLVSMFVVSFVPVLTNVVTSVAHFMGSLRESFRNTEITRFAIIALSGVLAARLLPQLAGVARWLVTIGARTLLAIAPWALLALVLDDVIGLFRGNDSALGALLDRMFGVGASVRFVRAAREAWQGVLLVVRDLGQAFRDLGAWIQSGIDTVTFWASAWVDQISNVAGAIRGAFTGAFDWIEEQLGGLLTRTWNRIAQSPVGRFIGRVASFAGGAVRAVAGVASAPVRAVVGGLAGSFSDTANLLHGRGLTETDASYRARGLAAGATGTGVDARNQSVNVTVHTTGGDPHEIARTVAGHVERQRRAHHDAAHPQPQRSQ